MVGDITEIELRAELEQAIENALFVAENVSRKVTVRSTDEGARAEAIQFLAIVAQIRSLRRALHAEIAG